MMYELLLLLYIAMCQIVAHALMFVSFSSQSYLRVFPPFVVCKCVFHSGTVQFVPVAHHEGVWASSGITPHVLNP